MANSWQPYLDSFHFQSGRKPKTADANDLRRFEAAAGFRLPSSYRHFALAIGLGQFLIPTDRPDRPHWVDLTCPGCDGPAPLCDPAALTRYAFTTGGYDDELINYYDDPTRLRRLLFFAARDCLDFWGWDPQDVTDPAARECRIYQVLPHTADPRVLPVAATFAEFLLDFVCQGLVRPMPRLPGRRRRRPAPGEAEPAVIFCPG